jgi:hypothetical protein
MNPADKSEQSNSSLPLPMGQPPQMPSSALASASLEMTGAAPPAYAPQAQMPIIATQPIEPNSSAVNGVPDTTNIVVPQTADDSDLIEKEWVDKAKKIVQSNLENPYEQSRELTNLKAEYMKKRYNKDIRLGE